MTDEEIQRLVQAAVDNLAAVVNAEVNQALTTLAAAITEDRQALATVAGALADRPNTPAPPQLGELVVRLEPAPSLPTTKRVERDPAGNITRILEESTKPG